jgi:hypothetical protein
MVVRESLAASHVRKHRPDEFSSRRLLIEDDGGVRVWNIGGTLGNIVCNSRAVCNVAPGGLARFTPRTEPGTRACAVRAHYPDVRSVSYFQSQTGNVGIRTC